MARGASETLGLFRTAIAAIGASFIYFLIRVFGRKVRDEDVPWLLGPFGGDYIGDKPYEECAERERLSLERQATTGGLLPDFDDLGCDGFDASAVEPRVRHFYENTTRYRMDVWAESFFPGSIGLWLLVTTISRRVNQLNFPLRVLETARGMDSEIVLLRTAAGDVRYAGWYRRLAESGRVIYTGFYMTERVPGEAGRCVKVVFPMPQGNATVILRPGLDASGAFVLDSHGARFGEAGFYRVQRAGAGLIRAWRVQSLKEHFRLYIDDRGTLRCDHRVRFLGLPILHLHYRIDLAEAAC